ncbi:ABC transporter substrate-binding protein [Fusobacterium sp.]|uniref:ABC transporter substrate-binding protein n=1 Tax=Fusobacterium sp. TaxID=68766 RepID=UPI00260830C1|nr:ABC transporter substrate-binding protein [Fusobacterium sp.]
MKKIIVIFFIIFINIFGSEIKEYKYNRIVSLTLSGDEMLLDLVDTDRIVGLSGKINEDKEMSNIWDRVGKFPKVESNIEVLANLEPDFVIAASWMKKEVLEQIQDVGAKVYIYKTPKNFKEQEQLILELSKLLEVEDNGKKIVKNMETRLEKLQNRIAKVKDHTPRMLMYTSFETTNGAETTFDDMVNQIGGENVAKSAGIVRNQKISKEKLIELDPEIIIIPLWSNHINSEEFIEFVKNDESFQNIQAVKNNKVYVLLHKKLSPTSQYMIDGIEALGEVIYNLESESL